jgi:hypothetical protein
MKKIEIDPETVKTLKERGGSWGVYQNMLFDSSTAGHIQFLKVGEGCTYATAPKVYPADTAYSSGHKYFCVGTVEAKDISDDGKLELP